MGRGGWSWGSGGMGFLSLGGDVWRRRERDEDDGEMVIPLGLQFHIRVEKQIKWWNLIVILLVVVVVANTHTHTLAHLIVDKRIRICSSVPPSRNSMV